MKKLNIPITKLCLKRSEEEAVVKVIRSGWITQGPQVNQFEEIVAKHVGAKYAVATSSCTTALHLALLVSGVGPGDEVIVPSYSFIATANAIVYCGAMPVFVDIDIKTYNIDVNKLELAITKKTKAILIVHQVGLPADMDLIIKLAKRYKIKVIEDAACALGSVYKGKKIGSISDLTCFSFHPKKVVTTGEGGMITTNRKDYAILLRQLRNHGASISDLSRHKAKKLTFEQYRQLGFNYRMPDICAALGIVQMKKIDIILKRRICLAKVYNRAFKTISFIELPSVPDSIRHNWQSYILRIRGNSPISRDRVMRLLMDKNIATRRIGAIHLEPYYRMMYRKIKLPETVKAVKQALLIPFYPQITQDEQDYLIESFAKVMKGKVHKSCR